MKYLLLPITIIAWYFTTYYGLYFVFIAYAFMFSLSWIWIILGYPFLVGIAFGLTNGLPSILRLYILKLFDFNWFSIISHSLAGLFGVFMIGTFFNDNPPQIGGGNEDVFFLTGMWELAPFKTIIITLPFIGLAFSLIWSTVFASIYLKYKSNNLDPA